MYGNVVFTVTCMDDEIASQVVAQAGKDYIKGLEQKWREQKALEISDCHDAIVTATKGFPQHVIFAALQLFEFELTEEIIADIQAQIKKRADVQALERAQKRQQSAMEGDKLAETVNHQEAKSSVAIT